MASNNDIDNHDLDSFCPALPPHLFTSKTETKKTRIVGPTLPPNFQVPDTEIHSSDDEGFVGPLPPSAADDKRFNVPEMEDRLNMLIKNATKDDSAPVREEWMLELPNDKPNLLKLGLGPRQFRKSNKPESGDRSVWTDTPEDTIRKERQAEKEEETETSELSIEDLAAQKRDEELSVIVQNHNDKKRSAPLIETHSKKKLKNDEKLSGERRPFTREDDLQVNRFDEAQKEVILKKANQLNDRFSAGNRKFL